MPSGPRPSQTLPETVTRKPLIENCTWASVPEASQCYEIGGVCLREHARRKDLVVQSDA